MPLLSTPTSAAKMSLFYITIGALMDVWGGIWFWYLHNHPSSSDAQTYLCWGFLLTGMTLLVIGLALGRIGRAARHAESPPEEVTAATAQIEQAAAARAPIAAPFNPALSAVAPPAAVPVSAGAPLATVSAGPSNALLTRQEP